MKTKNYRVTFDPKTGIVETDKAESGDYPLFTVVVMADGKMAVYSHDRKHLQRAVMRLNAFFQHQIWELTKKLNLYKSSEDKLMKISDEERRHYQELHGKK